MIKDTSISENTYIKYFFLSIFTGNTAGVTVKPIMITKSTTTSKVPTTEPTSQVTTETSGPDVTTLQNKLTT